MAAILERHAVKAGVRIGQGGRGELAPSFTIVFRPRFNDLSLAAAKHRLEFSALVEEDSRLNHAELSSVIDRVSAAPRLAQIRGALEVYAPAVVLGAGGAEQLAVT